VKVPLLDLQAQYRTISSDLDAAVQRVMQSQRFILGEEVEAFELEIAQRIGTRHAVGCASGTDALLLSLQALDLDPGSEVVIPAFTFFATAGAVWNAGLKPVFADVDPRTFNVTPETIEAVVSGATRALIVVHLFGQMAPMAEILELTAGRGIAVIEDAAQAIDARQEIQGAWRAAGSLGDTGAFSFFPSKNLGGSGDGGMITTDDDLLGERLRKLRVHGGRQMYHHEMVGTNSRLDAIQAAILRTKLPHLESWTEARRRHARRYDAALANVDGIEAPHVEPGNFHVYNQYTVKVDDRDAITARAESAGVGTGIYYPLPLHLQLCFSELGYGPGDLPVSEKLAGEVLSLPVYPELTEDQQSLVVEVLSR
jgi:dTDP-4-amino-4,6-dideoxygalactose transaminase